VTRGSLLAVAALVVASAAACARTPPATPAVAALAIPTPPARLLIPVELPEYVEPVPEPVVAEAPAPAPVRSAATSRSTEKPTPPPPQPAVGAPAPPILQATPSAPSALEQRVIVLLTSAEDRLKTVNRGELGVARRAHFEQALDFIRMARENLRIRNYFYAEQLATKANQVAGLLTRG
jgi:hypothetical protein